MQLSKWPSLLLITFGVIVALVGVATWWFWDEPLRSPVSGETSFRFLREVPKRNGSNKLVYGFLPYWNVQKAVVQPELTHIGYFGLAILGDGSVQTKDGDGDTPGYVGLQSEKLLEVANELEARGGRLELVFTQFNGDDIVSFINSPKAQEKFFETLDTIILAYPVSGINIDIEPSGVPITPQLRANFVSFIADLRSHLDARYDTVPVSVDMYASASDNEQLWDLPALAQHVDFIVVMAYDYHRRGSTQAGPVAPVFGGQNNWSGDISEHLRNFLTYVPPQKLLLGIPFYGYEWQTTDTSAQANTFPESGATATLDRVADVLSKKKALKVEEFWNEAALSPYLSYVEDGKRYIIYYENPRSVSYKLDLVNQLNLGGLAIWAIGYEGEERVLWDVINQKIK